MLVVDDEELIVDGLTMLFEAESLESAGANDRQSAAAMVARTFYPVIIADLRLHTTEDGLDLLDDIRRISPTSRVVTLSAYATPEMQKEVLRRGVVAIVQKPASGADLVAIVQELLAEIEREADQLKDGEGLETLYAGARRVLHGIALKRYGLSPDEAEDVVQEAWLLFLEKRHGIRSARSWLAGTVANLCKRQVGRNRIDRELTIDDVFDELIEERELDRESVIAVRQALGQVDDRCRLLCTLIAVEGRSYDEVSAATGLPLGSIGPLYIRAKQKLRNVLSN
ncbi:MAG TPA: sigma-70 family RNA polymerase sigma factor [Thermoanaerobaculia bacterium]|nr:sigma-70 family RNA polymerase sigma factor [Thermoanaerobaculia bacterium]